MRVWFLPIDQDAQDNSKSDKNVLLRWELWRLRVFGSRKVPKTPRVHWFQGQDQASNWLSLGKVN